MLYSVIIPTYNRCYLLQDAIDSVMQQNHAQLEIIVVDDGSTDETASMIASKYPFIRYFYQYNQGPAAARNRGIAEANGELIAFLDSDDIWLEEKIATELQLQYEFPQADAFAGNASAFIENIIRSEDTFAQRDIIFAQQQPRFFDWSMSIMQRGPVCCTSSMTFKKETLRGIGKKPFDESLRFDEDWDFEFRLFNYCNVLLYPQVVCTSRAFNDGTRLFYSAPGQLKSQQEQQNIWHQQQEIIARYLDSPDWSQDTRHNFQQRHQELTALLR